MGLFESLKAVSIVNKKHIGDLKKLPLNDVVSYKISVLSDGKLLAKTTFNRFYKNYNINYYDILRDSWQESIAHRRRPAGRFNDLSWLAGYRRFGYHACNETHRCNQ